MSKVESEDYCHFVLLSSFLSYQSMLFWFPLASSLAICHQTLPHLPLPPLMVSMAACPRREISLTPGQASLKSTPFSPIFPTANISLDITWHLFLKVKILRCWMFRTTTIVDTSIELILNAFSFSLCFSVRFLIQIEGWTFSLGEACVFHRRSIGESSTGNLYRLLIRTKVLAR